MFQAWKKIYRNKDDEMLIEFELQGSQLLHKGIFDTHGFWVKYGVDRDDVTQEITTYKIWSHFSFTYETIDKTCADRVFKGLADALSGVDWKYPSIGYMKVLDD
jgi:hypothetical protein